MFITNQEGKRFLVESYEKKQNYFGCKLLRTGERHNIDLITGSNFARDSEEVTNPESLVGKTVTMEWTQCHIAIGQNVKVIEPPTQSPLYL